MREDILRTLPPDVADWSVADVCFYVKSHGFPGESKLFEEQVTYILYTICLMCLCGVVVVVVLY